VAAPTGAIIPPSEELLFRQVSPSFLKVGGFLSSQIFRPTGKDDGLLSVDRSSIEPSPEASLTRFNANGGQSIGVLAATVAEFHGQELACHEDPLHHNAAHAVANFQGLTRGQCEKKSKVLLACAEARGYLFQLPAQGPGEA
jgi:hypothetical protein